jgi:FkbM family methyltransferase
VIFEIGCKNGKLTNFYYSQAKGMPMYYAFEPDPRNLKEIKSNKEFPSGAKLVEKAIGNENGEISFFLSNGKAPGNPVEYTGCSSLRAPTRTLRRKHPHIQFRRKVKVNCTTVDSFCQQNNIKQIDLILCDIQGAEKDMILGAKKMLPNIKFMFLEKSDNDELYQGQWLKKDMVTYLSPMFKVLKDFKHDIMFFRHDMF